MYNHFFPYTDEKYIAFNAFTNSLAVIDRENYDTFQKFNNLGESLPEDLINDLIKGGFIIEDDINELDILRLRLLRGRFNTDSLSLTIAPTNDCQFACVYCYEKDIIAPIYMDILVQDKIIDSLESRKELISNFSVVWYGGEPLMAFETVENLSHRFIKICNNNKINYNASMVTNGYMLSPDLLKRMKDINISSLQITIDGLPDVHDKMRPLKSGGKTFDAIINNLQAGYELLPQVALRINIDKNNISSGEKILSLLKEKNMLEKVRPYFGKIISEAGTYIDSQCLSMRDFSELHYDFISKTFSDINQSPLFYPALKSAVCGADSFTSCVIDAEGWIYKCWSDIGHCDQRVGNIINGYDVTSKALTRYLLFDPTGCEQCVSCDVLPLCMGGCPYKRIVGSTDNCANYRYILGKCLTSSARYFQKQQSVDDLLEL